MREVVNTIFYLVRSGCQWDLLPHDLPRKSTVYDYFTQWRDDGTWQRIVDAMRQSVRKAAGKQPRPAVPNRGGESAGRETGIREVATALGCGADLRMAGLVSSKQPRLRAL